MTRGLDWLAAHQSRLGHWAAVDGRDPTSMTALAGIAMLCEGSTTTQGKYAANIRGAVDYLVGRSRTQRPDRRSIAMDNRYIYGHGFSMLFLSQVLGEEEDVERREQLVNVLNRAVVFTGRAQTAAGGWGYVSAKDGGDYDEGSTTITQVQGLRGCRNAGIPVPKEIIDKAIQYIRKCTAPDGGVQYNSHGGGDRPPDHRRGHRLPVQRRRLRRQVRSQAAGLLPEESHDSPTAVSDIGTTPTTITPRSSTARAARTGTTIAQDLRPHLNEVNPEGFWEQGSWARSTPRR